MSIEQIVSEVAALPDPQRKQLIGRLLALGRSEEESAAFRREMAARLDDDDPAQWMSYEELRRRLPAEQANG